MLDERGKPVDEAGPGIPVQVLGAAGVPQAGEAFAVWSAEMAAEIAGNRQRLEREKQLRIKERGFKLGDFSQLLAAGQVSTLPLIIKGDVDGSVQALSDSLEQLGTDEVKVEIIHRAVGAINESDVILAGPANAVIMGFRVRPDANARNLAEREGVDIHVFDVIYEAVDQVQGRPGRHAGSGAPGEDRRLRRGPGDLQDPEGRDHRRLLCHRRASSSGRPRPA